MQKFTRALTREIEVSGERLAVTFSAEGLAMRPVGSRRPPHTMSWEAVVHACANRGGAHAPGETDVGEALKAIKAGGPRSAESAGKGASSANEPQHQQEKEPQAVATHEHGGHANQPAEEEQEASGRSPRQGASAPAGDLAETLARLDRWLAAHRPHYHNALLPGASPSELAALQNVLGGPLAEDLRTWLRWHNGQDPDVPGALEENWRPLSAAEIAEAKRNLDAEGHPGWDRRWLPFLDDDNEDYLCLDPGASGTPVRECWRGRAEHGVVAPSLAAWVAKFLSGAERGEYAEDPERGGFHHR
jgi:cell wall assembly regulator SMI1